MKPEIKAALKKMRERHGPVTEELKASVKAQTKVKRGIRKELAGGARTVPELARAIGREADVVLGHLMSLKKYGEVVEVSDNGLYCRYARKEGER